MRAGLAALLLCVCVGAAPQGPVPAPLLRTAPAPTIRRDDDRTRIVGTPMQGGLIRGRAGSGIVAASMNGRPVPLAPDGRFLLGFDRDAGPVATLVLSHAPGAPAGEEVITLDVAPRAWAVERVDAPYRAGRTDAEFEAARPAELAAIVAARGAVTDADGWRLPLRWPAVGRLSGRFGAQRVYRGTPGSYHSGDDIAAPVGDPVFAPADGVVVLAADHAFTLEGNLLMIDHGAGLNSALLHLSRIDVRVGDRVRQGQVVGAVGRTGRVTGPHLHWSLQWLGAKLDPSLVTGGSPQGR